MSKSSLGSPELRVYLCSVPLSICIRKPNASSSREARRYLDKHLRLDTALQSYMSNRDNTSTPSSNELEKLFNKYKGVQLVPAALACPFLTHRHQTVKTMISPWMVPSTCVAISA